MIFCLVSMLFSSVFNASLSRVLSRKKQASRPPSAVVEEKILSFHPLPPILNHPPTNRLHLHHPRRPTQPKIQLIIPHTTYLVLNPPHYLANQPTYHNRLDKKLAAQTLSLGYPSAQTVETN